MSRFATFASRGVHGAWLETIIIMPSNFKNLVRARMAKTGESWQTAARNVRAEATADGRVGAKPPDGGAPMPFKTFRAQGFNGLDAVEFDGPRLLDILRGPFNSRKLGLLQALHLCRFLTAQQTDFGPPLGGIAIQVSISPDQVNANGRTPIVIAAEVVVAPEDFDEIGQKPVVVQLDRLRVTLELTWYDGPGPIAHYTISRFETGDGRDFAKGERNISEIRDIALAAGLCGQAVDTLLRSARSSHSRPKLDRRAGDLPLDKREHEVLDVVAEFQFAHAEYAPATEVALSFPPDAVAATELAVEGLLKKGYLDRRHETLALTPAGLLVCARAGEAAGRAQRLLDYLKYRAEAERGRFRHFTWPELKAANVTGASDSDYAFIRTVIATLRIEGGRSTWWGGQGGPVWASPDDIAELRAISNFNGLLLRAEGIRKQEAEEMARQVSPMPSVAANPVALLVTAVGSERKAVLDLLREDYSITPAREEIGGRYFNHFAWPGRGRTWDVLLGQPTEKGGPAAQSLLQDFVRSHRPELVLMVGMCGGLPENGAKEGMVILGRQVFNYEQARLREGAAVWSPTGYRSTARVLDLANALAAEGELGAIEVKTTKDYASGAKLIDDLSSELRQKIIALSGEIVGFEMEGPDLLHAVWELTRTVHFDVAVAKGVSDFGDGQQRDNKEARQRTATRNAAQVALKLLSAY